MSTTAAPIVIGTTIHDEEVRVEFGARYPFVTFDGVRHSPAFAGQADAIAFARSFVPAHRSAELAR